MSYAPEDFGKAYQLHIDIDNTPAGEHYFLSGFFGGLQYVEGLENGEVVNGQTYIIPEDFVQRIEGAYGFPLSILEVPSSSELIAE